MKKSNERICLISSPSKKSIKKILKIMNGRRFKWVYFGEDISQAVLIEETIGERGERLEIAGLLQETAKKLRRPYIDYIGKLSKEKNSLLWWAGSLSEKNPTKSKVFLYSCYIKTCIEILKKYPASPLVIFVENKVVKKTLIRNIPMKKITAVDSSREFAHEPLRILKFIIHKGWFLMSNLYRILVSKYQYRLYKRIKSLGPLLLIYTWIDRRSFDKEGLYHDVYLGKALEYLKKENAAILPYYVLSTIPYQKMIRGAAKSENLFLIPHSFLSIKDLFSVFSSTINLPKNQDFPKFEGMNITEVICNDLENDWIGVYVASDLLLYYLVKRLKEQQIQIDTVIYPYENLSWEKVLCTAMRKFYPSAYLIGYQHSTISRMYLNYFFSCLELKILPLPDRIVTNGRYTKELFIKSGYPEERVVQGGAVRYEYLLKSKGIKKRQKRDKPVVLVTPSINKFEAAELIWKVLKAFEQNDKYKIVIKCHPDMPFEIISKHLNIKLPGHFTVTNKPVAELLEESDVLLYTCSTTCVEAIAAGVPVIHVESDLMIDLDQLDFNPKLRPSARTPEEILNSVEKAISMNEKKLSRKRKIWGKVVRNLFGEVNESTYRLFLRDPRQNFRIDSLKN